jgi:hypothetical protein
VPKNGLLRKTRRMPDNAPGLYQRIHRPRRAAVADPGANSWAATTTGTAVSGVYAVELFALSVPVFVVLGRVMQFPADRCADYTQLT